MSGLSIVVFGEGPHELGRQLDKRLSCDALPALPRLIHRVLGEPRDANYTCRLFKDVRAAHGCGGKFTKKVISAMHKSQEDGFDAAVIVIDRDREAEQERIVALQSGRNEPATVGDPPCAVGTAVETFDAWMIADGGAIKQAGGNADGAHPSPENLNGKEGTGNHPKDQASEAFGGPDGLDVKYAAVAGCVDLDHLERVCPKGFRPFAADVRDRIGPLLPRART